MPKTFIKWLTDKYSQQDDKLDQSSGTVLAQKTAAETAARFKTAAHQDTKKEDALTLNLHRVFNGFPDDFIGRDNFGNYIRDTQAFIRKLDYKLKNDPKELTAEDDEHTDQYYLTDASKNKLQNLYRFYLSKVALQLFDINPVQKTIFLKDEIWTILGVADTKKQLREKYSDEEICEAIFQGFITNLFCPLKNSESEPFAKEVADTIYQEDLGKDTLGNRHALFSAYDKILRDKPTFVKNIFDSIEFSFTDYLKSYFDKHTPKPDLNSLDPRNQSRYNVDQFSENSCNNLTRIFNDFPRFLNTQQTKEFEDKLRSVDLDTSMGDAPSNDSDIFQKREFFKKKIKNREDIEKFINQRTKHYFHQLFNFGPDQTINLKPEIENLLGITPALYNKFGKIKVLKAIYSGFVNNFLFNGSEQFNELFKPTSLNFDVLLGAKETAFSSLRNEIAEQAVEDLFEPYIPFEDRAGEAFDYVYNPDKEYPSRTNAFFGWRFPYITALVETPLNIVRGVTEYLPTLIQKAGDHLVAKAKHESDFGGDATYLLGRTLQVVGWVWREVGMTITSPWKAANETYDWVKQKTGSKILGGIAGFFRMLPAAIGATVAIIATCGVAAAPIFGTAKVGFFATAVTKIQAGLGWLGGWIASKFGASVTAKVAASAAAKITVASSTATTVCVAGIASNAMVNGVRIVHEKYKHKKELKALASAPEFHGRNPNAPLSPIDYVVSRGDWKEFNARFQAKGYELSKANKKTAPELEQEIADLKIKKDSRVGQALLKRLIACNLTFPEKEDKTEREIEKIIKDAEATSTKQEFSKVSNSQKGIRHLLAAASEDRPSMKPSTAVIGSSNPPKINKSEKDASAAGGPPVLKVSTQAAGHLVLIPPPVLLPTTGVSDSPTSSERTNSSSGGTPPVAPSTPEPTGTGSPRPLTPGAIS